MKECVHRNGSGVERVLAEGIEVLIFAEKFRGSNAATDTILRVLVG